MYKSYITILFSQLYSILFLIRRTQKLFIFIKNQKRISPWHLQFTESVAWKHAQKYECLTSTEKGVMTNSGYKLTFFCFVFECVFDACFVLVRDRPVIRVTCRCAVSKELCSWIFWQIQRRIWRLMFVGCLEANCLLLFSHWRDDQMGNGNLALRAEEGLRWILNSRSHSNYHDQAHTIWKTIWDGWWWELFPIWLFNAIYRIH